MTLHDFHGGRKFSPALVSGHSQGRILGSALLCRRAHWIFGASYIDQRVAGKCGTCHIHTVSYQPQNHLQNKHAHQTFFDHVPFRFFHIASCSKLCLKFPETPDHFSLDAKVPQASEAKSHSCHRGSHWSFPPCSRSWRHRSWRCSLGLCHVVDTLSSNVQVGDRCDTLSWRSDRQEISSYSLSFPSPSCLLRSLCFLFLSLLVVARSLWIWPCLSSELVPLGRRWIQHTTPQTPARTRLSDPQTLPRTLRLHLLPPIRFGISVPLAFPNLVFPSRCEESLEFPPPPHWCRTFSFSISEILEAHGRSDCLGAWWHLELDRSSDPLANPWSLSSFLLHSALIASRAHMLLLHLRLSSGPSFPQNPHHAWPSSCHSFRPLSAPWDRGHAQTSHTCPRSSACPIEGLELWVDVWSHHLPVAWPDLALIPFWKLSHQASKLLLVPSVFDVPLAISSGRTVVSAHSRSILWCPPRTLESVPMVAGSKEKFLLCHCLWPLLHLLAWLRKADVGWLCFLLLPPMTTTCTMNSCFLECLWSYPRTYHQSTYLSLQRRPRYQCEYSRSPWLHLTNHRASSSCWLKLPSSAHPRAMREHHVAFAQGTLVKTFGKITTYISNIYILWNWCIQPCVQLTASW